MGKYVGIDLGTTFSAVAYIDEKGNPQVVPNSDGNNITPSAVLFDEGNPVVGDEAKKGGKFSPGCYADFIKRHMGDKNFIFHDESSNSDYRPEDISAMILKKLKLDTENYLGDTIDGAVITVPAYFTDLQRQSTKDAAEIAGVPLLALINEPTAAAIAFGVTKNISDKQKVMIYDFGGGTFDVSILEIDSENIKVLSTNGDATLGGYDIDKAIYDYVVSQALENGFDIEGDIDAKQSLMLEAENAKKSLSRKKSKATITLYVQGKKYSQDITQEVFDGTIIDTIIERTASIMQGAIDEANLTYEDLDKVLLVGGSTRIPAVADMIENETRIRPSSEVHPDEAVCIGAAFHAIDVAKREKAVDVQQKESGYDFKDVTSHGIGTVVYDENSNKEYNSIIVAKNTQIPVEMDRVYSIPANSKGINFQITSGEYEDLEYTTIIGEAVLKVVPKDHDVPVKVVISCDKNSIIHARAIDLEECMDLGEIEIDRSEHNMTTDEVNDSKERINRLNIGD